MDYKKIDLIFIELFNKYTLSFALMLLIVRLDLISGGRELINLGIW